MTAVNLNRAVRGPVTAVPVVAGKGVRLVADTVNNRFVVEADETVLFDNGSTSVSECTLLEAASNFEYLDFVVGFPGESNGLKVERVPGNASVFHFMYGAGQGATDYFIRVYGTINGTAVATGKSKASYSTYNSTTAETIRNNSASDMQCIYKVVGINRIAST